MSSYVIVGGICLIVGCVVGVLVAANNTDKAAKAKELASAVEDKIKEQLDK